MALRIRVLLLVAALLSAPSVGVAQIPSPCMNSSFPAYLDLVGCSAAGAVDPWGEYVVVVRDIGNFPMVGQTVSIVFKSDVATCLPGACVTAVTDESGRATFHVAGAGRNAAGAAGWTGASAARVFVGNCERTGWCAAAHVCTYDENGYAGSPGVEITDLAALAADWAQRATVYRPRSDFSHGGSVDIVDVSYWGKVFNAHQSRAACPGALTVNSTW